MGLLQRIHSMLLHEVCTCCNVTWQAESPSVFIDNSDDDDDGN